MGALGAVFIIFFFLFLILTLDGGAHDMSSSFVINTSEIESES